MNKMTTTLAYVLEKVNAPFVLRDVVLDELQPSEVLVEIKYTGLCHTVCYHLIRPISNTPNHISDQIHAGYRCSRRRHANRPLPRRLGSRRHRYSQKSRLPGSRQISPTRRHSNTLIPFLRPVQGLSQRPAWQLSSLHRDEFPIQCARGRIVPYLFT